MSNERPSHVGFIGLGTMGLPMASNLLRGGFSVRGYDLRDEAVAALAAAGGTGAASAAEAAAGADVLFTMLPTGAHVRQALFGKGSEGGALAADPPPPLLIEMSTIHPHESDALRTELAAHGVRMIDAPVGRTSEHAVRGTLLIMAGGEKADLARAAPLFAVLGDTVIDCGGPGRGVRMKMVNNFLSIALNALTAEALTLAEASGLERAVTLEVLSGTAAGQGHLRTTYPSKVLAGDLSPAFRLDLAHKDMGLALELAAALKVPVPLGAAAREVYSTACAQGRGEQDWTAVLELVRQLAGLER